MRKINSLTSMRFFAASAIVFMHSRDAFTFTRGTLAQFPLHYGVTFFFVLSGFILTYTYINLKRWQVPSFFIARFARIWPAHFATLVIFLILIPSNQWIWEGANPIIVPLANITLTHAIIPIPEYYFSLNGVSWSISTELFFYVAFPFIILSWRHAFFWIGATLILLATTMILFATAFNFPPFSPQDFLKITSHGIAYINPATRLFEFFLGMCAAFLVIKDPRFIDPPKRSLPTIGWWTAAEVAALLLAMNMFVYFSTLPSHLGWGNTAISTYVMNSPGAIFCALLIVIFSYERGLISRFLKLKILVTAGELSYSLYLIHQIYIRWYGNYGAEMPGTPGSTIHLILYILACLISSYALMRLVEFRMRNFIRTHFQSAFDRISRLARTYPCRNQA